MSARKATTRPGRPPQQPDNSGMRNARPYIILAQCSQTLGHDARSAELAVAQPRSWNIERHYQRCWSG